MRAGDLITLNCMSNCQSRVGNIVSKYELSTAAAENRTIICVQTALYKVQTVQTYLSESASETLFKYNANHPNCE